MSLDPVKEIFRLFSEDNRDAMLNHISTDFRWRYHGPDEIPWAGYYEGHEGVRRFFDVVDRHLSITHFEIDDYIDAGSKVIVAGRSEARLLSNNNSYKAHWINIFSVKGDTVTALEDLYDTGAVLKALRGETPAANAENRA